MNERPIEKIIKVASMVQEKSETEYMVRSPLRTDKNPSVHVKVQQDDSLLIFDHGGGDIEETLKAWGLNMRDLYPDNNGKRSGLENTIMYDYLDENGELKYQVLRKTSHDGSRSFMQRQPDGQGGWLYHTRGIRPVPYMLPQLLAGLKNGEMIYVVEGEKDADTLNNLGMRATTNHGGANKWREEHSTYFAVGGKVSIIPDNDEVGHKHAIQVADALKQQGCDIRVIELPGLGEKGDVSDWLSNGHTREEFLGIVQKAWEKEQQPIYSIAEVHENKGRNNRSVRSEPVYICASEVEEEEIEWIWPGYIASKKVCIIDGDPGVGKTWLGLFFAAAVSQGWEMPDATTGQFREGRVKQRRNVIYMTAEDGLEDTLVKRLNLLGADSHNIYFLTGKRCKDGDADMELNIRDTEVIRQAIQEINPAIIIVDPIQGFLGPKLDIHRANQVRPVMSTISQMAEEGNCAFVLMRHLNKNDKGKPIYRGMGSVDFTAAARTVLLLVKDHDGQRIVFPIKNNLGIEGVPVSFFLAEEIGMEWVGKDDRTIEEILYYQYDQYFKKPRSNALLEAKDFLQQTLTTERFAKQVKEEAELMGISARTLRRAREELGISCRKMGEQWYWSLPTNTHDIFQ